MSLANWKTFHFFEETQLRDPSFGSPDPLYSTGVTATCSTKDFFVVATNTGVIRLITPDFQLRTQFQAYELGYTVCHLQSLDRYLVSIAEKQGFPSVLKLWDMERVLGEEMNEFKFHTSAKISNGTNAFPMTAFAATADFSVLACGYANGAAVVVRGDLLRDRGSRQRVVYESAEPVTGVRFRDESVLYITTTSRILTVPTTGRNQGKPDKILDKKQGCDLGCAYEDSGDLVVARDDGLTFYNTLGKHSFLPLEVAKRRVFNFGKYLLIVTETIPERSEQLSSLIGGTRSAARVLIVDLKNRFVAHQQSLQSAVSDVFHMWGDTYLYTKDGLLWKFHEKAQQQQIDAIVARENFPVAIALAREYAMDETLVMGIVRHYADYLYLKNEHDRAMDQYVVCAAIVEPSEVILKYKGNENIYSLIRYLEKLTLMKMANNDHTTLLVCCYCKMKKVAEIDRFIEDFSADDYVFHDASVGGSVPAGALNLNLVVNLLRECGYFRQAVRLLGKLGEHNTIVEIQLHDLKRARACVRYVRSLPYDEALRILINHSKTLLDRVPIETTQLLIDVFTAKYFPEESDESAADSRPEEPDSSFPLQSYKAFVSYISLKREKLPDDPKPPSKPTYTPPRPRLIFPSFVGKPHEFVVFLEACVETYTKLEGNETERKDILVTLLEMYLTLADESEGSLRSEWQTKASLLIRAQRNVLDAPQVLLLATIFDFAEGELLAKDQPGYEIDLFRSSCAAEDVPGAISLLLKYGDAEPQLYVLALTFYVSCERVYEAVGAAEVARVLREIQARDLVSPLELIQTLSATSVASIGLVKSYLVEYVQQQNEEIANNEKLIESYRKETETKKREIRALKQDPLTVQTAKCAICGGRLDFPVVHFKCAHSYHQRCLAEADVDALTDIETCPTCASEVDQIVALREQEREVSERMDLLDLSLQNSEDRFKIVADFMGRGAMDGGKYVFDS
ncbi:hypothetical protein BABINDRAFT_159013 [Babjeviella inositovora NRRL Y-12698]|uniref:E3 ubiquitin-protein ligase PEP5 n=1 Tax=Babjeviella inositovora NRRL Y-12698 TaxID=984486 RepID=A0A1E3QZA2_9ASCO|nr:uncharacterized protein BABINDRAFT_159013 [Babjeviella inositovora NRRL Y-12698]ODQ82417.1 hypothetical protein BABINDRAFT_159013 [Babjeviella inositovora NRRL Y-12698]